MNFAAPMMYRRHILLGSIISRWSHSKDFLCHERGARFWVPA